MKKELWKDISGYEGYYQISNTGKVKSCSRIITRGNIKQTIYPKIMSPSVNKRFGYKNITLRKNGIRAYFRICRLVAEAFIPNPLNKPCVNHKNGIKTDDRQCNLEWCTYSENMKHAIKNKLIVPPNPMLNKRGAKNHLSKPVIQKNINGKKIAEYESMNLASELSGCSKSSIFYGCKNKMNNNCTNTKRKYIWEYK